MFADITSANVVGYKAEALQEGTRLMAPCFVDVGTESDVDLTKFVPGGSYKTGDIQVDTLDYAGRTIKKYSYNVPRRGTPGWYDFDTNTEVSEGEVIFKAGEGVCVTGLDDLTLTTAGQVSTDDRVIALREGTTPCGNSTAVALDLTAIVPGGNYKTGDIQIDTVDYAGRTVKKYSFNVPRRGTPGWYDFDTNAAINEGEVIFHPGEGFTVTGLDGLTITIPGPTL